jgi:hypothetical protein
MTNGRLTTTDTRPALSPPRGRLGRYALWQFRDFALQRGAAMAAIAGALAYPVIRVNHADRGVVNDVGVVIAHRAPDSLIAAQNSVAGVLIPVIVLGTILVVRGIVSDDRQQGYHRFLFAKPVSITRYYAQSYLVQFTGLLAVVGLLIGLFAAFLRPVAMMPGLFAAAALFFALVGSVGFLLSTLVRADWLWLLVTLGTAGIVGGFYSAGERWLAPLVAVLPPVNALGNAIGALVNPAGVAAVSPAELLWILGYGALSVALALFILRRRALPA